MKPSLDDLRAFSAIAEHNSFNDAATALHLTQSAITRRLKKLEESLQIRLLDRTTRSVALTAVGQQFLPIARRLLRDFEDSLLAVEDMITQRGGQVIISSLMSVAHFFLPYAITQFHDAHPSIRVTLLDQTGAGISQPVLDGKAEFGIDMQKPGNVGIAFEPLFEERFMLACPPDHPLAGESRIAWKDLAGVPIIRLGLESGVGNQLEHTLAETNIRNHWWLEVQHLSTLSAFVTAGAGVGVLPNLVVQGHKAKEIEKRENIVFRPLIAPEITRTIGIITKYGTTLSPMADKLISFLKNEIAEISIETA